MVNLKLVGCGLRFEIIFTSALKMHLPLSFNSLCTDFSVVLLHTSLRMLDLKFVCCLLLNYIELDYLI